jgi:hypothetical protein
LPPRPSTAGPCGRTTATSPSRARALGRPRPRLKSRRESRSEAARHRAIAFRTREGYGAAALRRLPHPSLASGEGTGTCLPRRESRRTSS